VHCFSLRLNLPLLVATALLFAVSTSAFQVAPANTTANSDTVSLKGTVVDSATGEAIHGVLVEVSGTQTRAMLTGGDGKFDFEGLPPGDVVVRPRKPGYFSAYDLSPERQHLENISLENSPPPIVLKLMPEGVIYGRATAENGEPLEGLPVIINCMQIVDGHRQLEQTTSARTDEDGVYRAADLRPGSYYVSVGPSDDAQFLAPQRIVQHKQGYPLTFYPAAAEFESAAPIPIKPGTRAEINFALAAQPVFELSGTINGYFPQQGVNIIFVDGAGNPNTFQFEFDEKTGIFHSHSVPQGSYRVGVFSQAPTGGLHADMASINVSANIANLHFALTAMPSISVAIAANLAGTTYQGAKLFATVRLKTTDRTMAGADFTSETSGRPNNPFGSIKDVLPGTYNAIIQPHCSCYIASATYGSTDLLRDPLVISTGTTPPEIDIEVRDDGATLSGTVMNDGQPAPAEVVLIPDRSPEHPQVTATDEHGYFQVSMLAPGGYNVLAFDQIVDLEYANPQALQQYATSEKAITLTPNGKATMQLDLIRRKE
jgi:hypothetical protein